MPFKVSLKRVLHFLGLGLTLVSLSFVGYGLYRQFGAIISFEWGVADIGMLAGAAVITTASLFTLAFSWALMLHEGNFPKSRLVDSVLVYAKTSILKYLPGNVFHFVGRNVAGRQLNVGHGRLAAASVLEIGFSLLSATLLSALVFSFAPAPFSQSLFQVAAFGLVAVVTIVLCFPQIVENLAQLLPSSLSLAWIPKKLAGPMISNIVAFMGIMSAAAFLGFSILPEEVGPASTAALFIFAWVVGFVVPGAPGGIGVREAFLVVELEPLTGEFEALAFALMMRLVTTVGDVAFYLGSIFLAFLLKKRKAEEAHRTN